MSLYETMFSQYDITTSQLLVTAFDFTSPERRRNIQFVISQLLKLGIVPLLNENDAVSANQGYALFGNSFADNDSLASMVAVEMSAQLLILLTDVNGVYDRPPSDPSAKLINVFTRQSANFKVGEKSLQGRGGMGAKVDAALKAVNGGVQAVIIAAGGEHEVIDKIIRGDPAGTAFFLIDNCDSPEATNSGDDGADRFIDVMSRNTSFDVGANGHAADESLSAGGAHQIAAINGTRKGSDKEKTKVNISVEEIATRARDSSRQLNQVSESLRKDILKDIANSLQLRLSEILNANAVDLEAAEKR